MVEFGFGIVYIGQLKKLNITGFSGFLLFTSDCLFFAGLKGVVKLGSRIYGELQFLRRLISNILSLSSVTLPPQLIWPVINCMESHGISSASSIKFLNILIEVSKSESLNSYFLFHPIDPNFFLSYMIEWKKLSPKTKDFQHLCKSNCRSNSARRAAFTFKALLILVPPECSDA